MRTEFEMGGYRMTYEGAKATILLEYCGADSCEGCDNCVLGIAIKALEKQVPKKPVTRTIYNKYLQQKETFRVCPVCGINIPVPRELSSWELWCPDCGQSLDWSDEE